MKNSSKVKVYKNIFSFVEVNVFYMFQLQTVKINYSIIFHCWTVFSISLHLMLHILPQ